MIEQITKYRTNDGKLFDTVQKATDYIEDTICQKFDTIITGICSRNVKIKLDHFSKMELIKDMVGSIDNARAVQSIFNILDEVENEYNFNHDE